MRLPITIQALQEYAENCREEARQDAESLENQPFTSAEVVPHMKRMIARDLEVDLEILRLAALGLEHPQVIQPGVGGY